MSLMPGFKRFFRRSDGDVGRDIDDELQFHLDIKARDLEAGALSPAGAKDTYLYIVSIRTARSGAS